MSQPISMFIYGQIQQFMDRSFVCNEKCSISVKESDLNLQQNFLEQQIMSNKENTNDLQLFPSLFSSSAFVDDISIKNQLSLKLNAQEDLPNIAFGSFGDFKVQSSQKFNDRMPLPPLQLHRCTSFQEMLMENHRTVLVDSIHDYFIKTKHHFLKTTKNLNEFWERRGQKETNGTMEEAQLTVTNILSQNPQLGQLTQRQMVDRLRQNADELNIVSDMMNICPKQISFEVLFLICAIFEDCNEIIQHFKRKILAKVLQERSIKLAKTLRKMPCLKYLFEGDQKTVNFAEAFEVLLEKWMITLFLMKVGVFENQLETKSIEECLHSQAMSKIDLNDLLNQHLIRPSKKPKTG